MGSRELMDYYGDEIKSLKTDVKNLEGRMDKVEVKTERFTEELSICEKKILEKLDSMRFRRIFKWWHVFSGAGTFLLLWFCRYLISLDPSDMSHPIIHFLAKFNF
jgi:hypothetical protein